jgi:formate--tetrahydrofolate ligase
MLVFLFEFFSASQTSGLPTRPVFFDIDIDPKTGKIVGLS